MSTLSAAQAGDEHAFAQSGRAPARAAAVLLGWTSFEGLSSYWQPHDVERAA